MKKQEASLGNRRELVEKLKKVADFTEFSTSASSHSDSIICSSSDSI